MGSKVKVNTKWIGEMAFESTVGDHKIRLDAAPEVGGNNSGARPKPLMLVALAGCTGIDVVSLMKKMRVNFDSLDIDVEGDLNDDHPKFFRTMKIIFTIKGRNVDREKVEKAVTLSKEKYCGVSALYAKAIPLEYEIIISKD